MGHCTGCGGCCNPVVIPRESVTKTRIKTEPKWVFFYECRHYNIETRQCLDYENRPSICRGFPWYGKEPVVSTLDELPDCGYREDLPA